jgi:hypothetical protein
MKLVLEAVVMELSGSGNLMTGYRDASEVCGSMDGTEIDGIRFGLRQEGSRVELTLEGDGLSDGIQPNYPKLPLAPLRQVGFKTPEARLTANALNKLMRRVNKGFPGRTIVVKDVTSFV